MTAPLERNRIIPWRSCRNNNRAPQNHPLLQAMDDFEQQVNPHYLHRFIFRNHTWRTAPIFTPEKRLHASRLIQGQPFRYETAKWFILANPSAITDKYVRYSRICARVKKPAWRYLANHLVAITLPFYYQNTWWCWIAKVKNNVCKYDGDYDNVQLRQVQLDDLHEFHGATKILHEFLLDRWNELPDKLCELLCARPRFSNNSLMTFLGLRPHQSLIMLHDGTLHLFQVLSTKQYFWKDPIEKIAKIGVIPVYDMEEVETEEKEIDWDKWGRVCSYAQGVPALLQKWLRKWLYKRSDLIPNRSHLWRIRYLTLLEIRQVANITDDVPRLLDLIDALDKKPPDKSSYAFREWVRHGETRQFGYLFEVFGMNPNQFLNHAPPQQNTRHPSILLRIGESNEIVENMKQEIKWQICENIQGNLNFATTFTTKNNAKSFPISVTVWKYGGKALMEELNLDVSHWDEQVSAGEKISILLNFGQILKLKSSALDYFYMRFRAPEMIVENKRGLFRNYQESWLNYYCNASVLTQNSVLHLPSDMVVNHLVYLECPVSNRLANDSAWHLKVHVLNAEYVLESYTFQPNLVNQDFDMVPQWNRILNMKPNTFEQDVDPFLGQVLNHLQELHNREWKSMHDQESRFKAVQKHLSVSREQLNQMLVAPQERVEEEKAIDSIASQGVMQMMVPPLEPISIADIREYQVQQYRRQRAQQQNQVIAPQSLDPMEIVQADDTWSIKSNEFGDC